MRITIFGAGAIGCHLGAKLARAGQQVSLVARGAQLAALQATGLRFRGPAEEFHVHPRAVASARDLGPQDLVISAVKSHALPGVADDLLSLCGPDTRMLFAVNGLPWWYLQQLHTRWPAAPGLERLDPEGLLGARLGLERVLGCVVQSANEITEPGVVVNRSDSNLFAVGEPAGGISPRLQALVAELTPAIDGLSGCADLPLAIWDKLLHNMAMSPLACLGDARGGEIATTPELRGLFATLVNEGAGVAAALGLAVPARVDARLARMYGSHHRSSMLQDLRLCRPLEIDGQLRVVQDLARAAGVPTPAFDALLALLLQRARASGLYPMSEAVTHAQVQAA